MNTTAGTSLEERVDIQPAATQDNLAVEDRMQSPERLRDAYLRQICYIYSQAKENSDQLKTIENVVDLDSYLSIFKNLVSSVSSIDIASLKRRTAELAKKADDGRIDSTLANNIAGLTDATLEFSSLDDLISRSLVDLLQDFLKSNIDRIKLNGNKLLSVPNVTIEKFLAIFYKYWEKNPNFLDNITDKQDFFSKLRLLIDSLSVNQPTNSLFWKIKARLQTGLESVQPPVAADTPDTSGRSAVSETSTGLGVEPVVSSLVPYKQPDSAIELHSSEVKKIETAKEEIKSFLRENAPYSNARMLSDIDSFSTPSILEIAELIRIKDIDELISNVLYKKLLGKKDANSTIASICAMMAIKVMFPSARLTLADKT